MRWLAILAILGYRALLRRFHRRVCLFPESCSAYAIRVLRAHGFRRGLALTRVRLRTCRLPLGACFVLDARGRARLLSASSPVPPGALAYLKGEAERSAPWRR